MKQYPPTAKRTVGWETSQAKTNGPSQLTSPRPMSTRPQPAIVTRSMLQPVAGLADMSLGPVRIPNLRNLKHRKERLLYMPMPDYCKPSGNLVAISPDGTVSANVMKDSTAIFVSHIFSEDNNPKLFTVPNYGSALSWVAVCKSRVAYGYQGGIMEWDLKMPGNPGKGWNISENDGHSKMAAYSNDGSIFAYIQSKTYSVIGVSSKPEYTTPSGAKQFPRLPRTRRVESRSELVRLALSPSGDFLAICRIQENSFSQMKAVRINVISVQAVLDALDDHLDDSLGGFWTPGDSCHAMEFSPNGSLLAFITGKRLHVWKVEEGRSGRVYIQDQNQFRTLGELFLDVKSGQPYLAFCPKSHFLVVLTTHSLEFRVINCRTGIVYTVSWQQDSVLASKYWLTGPLFFMPQGGLMAFCYGHFRPTIGDSDESESDQSQSAKCIGIFELASPSDLDQMEVGNKTLSTTKSSS